MENEFYSRATGKLTKASHKSYVSKQFSNKDHSSIYSLEDDEDDYSQHPTGHLSPKQIEYISAFISGITSNPSPIIDETTRAIHWMGSWRIDSDDITVSCSILQPHITNCQVVYSGLTHSQGKRYSSIYFSDDQSQSPTLVKTIKYFQSMGKYSIPFAEKLIENRIISSSKVSWNNIVLSQTQPIFCIIAQNKIFECKLTHPSCKIISENMPASCNISFPSSEGHNVSFRSSAIQSGTGTGPSITLHTSGVIQYQGNARYISYVTSSFKDCIDTVMNSDSAVRFVKSLAVLRDMTIP